MKKSPSHQHDKPGTIFDYQLAVFEISLMIDHYYYLECHIRAQSLKQQ